MLDRQHFFIREHAGMFKHGNTYDILDPETEEQLGMANEKFGFMKIFTQRAGKRIEVVDTNEKPVFTIVKSFQWLLRPTISVLNAEGQRVGYFTSKLVSLSGGFWVYNDDKEHVAEVKGSWRGKNFQFVDKEGTKLGSVGEQSAGWAKSLFTDANHYSVSLEDHVKDDDDTTILLLAAAITIDLIFNEGNSSGGGGVLSDDDDDDE